MGGRSQGQCQSGSSGLLMTAEVVAEGGGFVSCRSPLFSPPLDLSAQAGLQLFQERCMECHRYNASGEMAFGSPPLLGRQGWYLADQLKKFKTGLRGTHKSDVNGAKMVQITNFFIEDDQMLRDVVAYILTLNPDPAASKETQEKQILEGSPFKDVTAVSQ
jgi:cytochrome c553